MEKDTRGQGKHREAKWNMQLIEPDVIVTTAERAGKSGVEEHVLKNTGEWRR